MSLFTVTTSRILAEKALQRCCGEQCVAWAIGLLESGHEEETVLELAGQLPPFNHFEIAALRDRVLRELGVVVPDTAAAITVYSLELFRDSFDNDQRLIEALHIVAELGIANDYQDNLKVFYDLRWAYDDLQRFGIQWYWNGAHHDNILDIVRAEVSSFLLSKEF